MQRGILVLTVVLAGCGGDDSQPAQKAKPKCPEVTGKAPRSLPQMRQAARAVTGPPALRRLAAEIAAVPADDFLDREDLLAQLAGTHECGEQAAALAERLRVAHYRHLARRAGQGHALRPHKLHDDQVAYDGILHFALNQYRQALDGTLGDLQGVEPPAAARRQHRRYLEQLRAINRFAARMEHDLETRPEKAFAAQPRLLPMERDADRAHAALMRATTR